MNKLSKAIQTITSVAWYTFIENIRNRMSYVIILFGAGIIAASLMLAALGGQQPLRIILDMGLGAIELFALISVCFAAVTLVIEEIESKTIYLIFTRPVPRFAYLTGRLKGLLLAVLTGMVFMALIHVAVLLFKNWDFSNRYLLAVFFSFLKIGMIGSVALFFSLISSSPVSSVSFTLAFWILGHFSQQLRFLSQKATLVTTKILATITYYIVPNFQYFNIKDFWDVPHLAGPWIIIAVLYAGFFMVMCLALSSWVLSRKEF